MDMPTIRDCRVLQLPKVTDPKGNLTFIEGGCHVPFPSRRIFYIYDVPTEESRGAHAHRTLEQFLICLSGSFQVQVDDGASKEIHRLNRPWSGLYIPPTIWAAETRFDSGSVCLSLASELYDEGDYIRDYGEFLRFRGLR